MLEDTNRSNDLFLLDNTHFTVLPILIPGAKVTRITDHHLGLYRLPLARHTDKLAVFIRDNLFDRLCEHVGAAVDGGESRKGLRELAESVHGVDVGGLAVSCHGRGVEQDSVVSFSGGLSLVSMAKDGLDAQEGSLRALRVVEMQRHCVTDKVLGTCFQAKLFVDVGHGVLVEVQS